MIQAMMMTSCKFFFFFFWISIKQEDSLGRVYKLNFCTNTTTIFHQSGWGPATIVEKSPNRIKQNQPISHSHRPPSSHSCFLLPFPHLNPSLWCFSLVAHLCHLWDLVRFLLDTWPVPQMATHQPWNLPGTPVNEVWAWGWAQPSLPSWCLCKYCGPS